MNTWKYLWRHPVDHQARRESRQQGRRHPAGGRDPVSTAYHPTVERRRLPVGIQTFRQNPRRGLLLRRQDRLRPPARGRRRQALFPVAPSALRQEPVRGHPQGAVRGATSRCSESLPCTTAWDWSRRHPVVRLSFAAGNFRRPDELLATSTAEQLADIEHETDGAQSPRPPPCLRRFARLLAALHRQAGRRVVVLVDEYDKPILDALDEPDVAKANRDDLRVTVRRDQGLRRARRAHLHHRGEQVLEGQPLLRP